MQTPLLLPTDPPELPDALHAGLEPVLAALTVGEPATLPAVTGVDGRMLARWLYRAWLDTLDGWRPLVFLAAPASPDAQRAAVSAARGGWLHVGAGLRPSALASLAAQTSAAGATLLMDDDGPPVPVPAIWSDRLRALDIGHVVATDPGLAGVRAALLAAARGGGPVLLSGPAGSGRRALVEGVHASLDPQPLVLVGRGASVRPPEDRWALFEEVAELDDDSRAALRERLGAGRERAGLVPPSAPRGTRPSHPAFAAILGESAALCHVLQDAATAAPTDLPVLILGEPGVGKELLARAIHEASGRSGPLVTVDVSALNENLIASELFGHVKGSFTGADRERAGAFRAADGGTLFLDELGNIPLPVQAMLLRALQEGEVRPVGSDRVLKVNVRVITATNADLQTMVQRGSFRADLLSRVAGRTLRLPPLRERREDILVLAARLLASARGDRLLRQPWASPEAEAALLGWPWTTNIRELNNTMRWVAAQTAPGETVELRHLGALVPSGRRACTLVAIQEDPDDPAAFPGLERRLVAALRASALRVPSLDERGPRSIRHAVWTLLDGHPISEEALEALTGRRWPGNLPQLAAALSALRSARPEGIDATAVRRVLPEVQPAIPAPATSPGWGAGMRVLMDPTLGPDGTVRGDIRDFAASEVLVGRGHGLAQLEEESRRDPLSAHAARAALLRSVVTGEPDHLRVRNQPALSRVHLLLRRRGDLIEVMEVPEVAVPVLAGSLERPGRARVSSWRPEPIGAACEVQVRREGASAPALQLFAFATEEAWNRWARVALERSSAESALSATLQDQQEIPAAVTAPRRVWSMSAAEADLLQEVVLGFAGGDFQAHVRQALGAAGRTPAATRLTAYLVGTPTAQYTGRLYQHNPEAAAELVGALDPEAFAALPGQLRRALG